VATDEDRVWATIELLRERTHQLTSDVAALTWRIRQLENERRQVMRLPARVAAVIVTAAAVYTALRVLLG
jgi:hypothetical protein